MKTLVVLAVSLTALFWNLENFFDPRDGGTGEADTEFSARGPRHWTRRRFDAKCRLVAKALLRVAEEEGLPDVIGVAEVENRLVLKRLLSTDALCKTDYRIVHFDSPDPRGIDVGLLYRASRWELLRAWPVPVRDAAGAPVPTRDLLCATLLRGEDTLHVVVCHFPSQYGGEAATPKRRAAVSRLKALTDSLAASGGTGILVMGDFNDTPEKAVFAPLSPGLVNLALPLARRGEGTIRYEGRWELIDQGWVSPSLAARSSFRVLRIPFLMERDGAHPGEKPWRTWSGPRYRGGVSDHLPILVKLEQPPFSTWKCVENSVTLTNREEID